MRSLAISSVRGDPESAARRIPVATAIEHYTTYKARPFTRAERDKVTILYGGLTWKHERLVQGTFHNLGYFFDRVGRLPRLVNVGNLKVKSQSKQTASNTITAGCVATTFVYVETPPSSPGSCSSTRSRTCWRSTPGRRAIRPACWGSRPP